MIVYVALTLSLIGILMAWSANRKNKELKKRIAETNSRIYALRRESQEAQEKAEHEIMLLKFEVLKLQGELKVTPEMKIGEVMAVHPQAEQVLAAFHLGGCASCFVDPGQTLSEAVAVNGRELEPVLAALNTLVAESNNGYGSVSPERVNIPNIELQF